MTSESVGTLAIKKNGGNGLPYDEWLKVKTAESRLKRKLIKQAQNEIKQELVQVAKKEQDKFERRVKAMDDWLMSKKLEEAQRAAHLREMDHRAEAEKQLREEQNTSSYLEWQRRQRQRERNEQLERRAHKAHKQARRLQEEKGRVQARVED